MRVVMTNTGKKPINWTIAGPGPYPPLFVKAKVTDVAGKTREPALTNGQTLATISGVWKSLAPGKSVVTPAALAPLPKGSYRIGLDGGSVRVRVEENVELLRKRNRDLLDRAAAGDPFAQHVVSTYLTARLRDQCLRDLKASGEPAAARLAAVLAGAPPLPDECMPLLARAVAGQLDRLAAARSTDHDLWDALTGIAAKNGSDQALELVIRVARSASNVSAGPGIRALGRFRQERATQKLRSLLKDPDASRRDLAALILASRHDEACLEVLLALAENPRSSWRGLACLALVNFPTDPRVEPAIRSCLGDRESGNQAAEALRKLGSAKKKLQNKQ
jgi:HEAT repeat protein